MFERKQRDLPTKFSRTWTKASTLRILLWRELRTGSAVTTWTPWTPPSTTWWENSNFSNGVLLDCSCPCSLPKWKKKTRSANKELFRMVGCDSFFILVILKIGRSKKETLQMTWTESLLDNLQFWTWWEFCLCREWGAESWRTVCSRGWASRRRERACWRRPPPWRRRRRWCPTTRSSRVVAASPPGLSTSSSRSSTSGERQPCVTREYTTQCQCNKFTSFHENFALNDSEIWRIWVPSFELNLEHRTKFSLISYVLVNCPTRFFSSGKVRNLSIAICYLCLYQSRFSC